MPVASSDQRTASTDRPIRWFRRYGVWITGLSLLIPEIVGSTFNIAYNIVHVETLLDAKKLRIFFTTISIYNLSVYPLAIVVWIRILWLLNRPYQKLLFGETVAELELLRSRRMAINLPWWGVGIGAIGWILCIPVFLGSLVLSPGPLDPRVFAHLPVSFLISALIAATHGFFLLEILAQRILYPVFFYDQLPSNTPGARPLSLRSRGLLWVLSAGVCPIASLLLLVFAPHDLDGVRWFALAVGGIGIAFGLTTAALVGHWITRPVDQLKAAAREVAAGNLDVQVDLLRADDFGPLIDEFNEMVAQLREKQHLHETFGRHVGEQAAQLILHRDPGLGGFEELITVVFVDIRNFTARCEHSTPQQAVAILNRFMTAMVENIEQHGGMVNKFLGDGFMAIFGLGQRKEGHADEAVAAGKEMLQRLETLNQLLVREEHAPLEIGIGIHTGVATVGSIGSPRRMEFTAIGDTVNVASRVEGLTKVVGHPLLMTAATHESLRVEITAHPLPPQPVKGQSEPIRLFRMGA